MRFLLYNIAYGTGAPRSHAHGALTIHRYLRTSRHHTAYLQRFIRRSNPDIVGLVEFDAGSYRTAHNTAAEFARMLEHNYAYSSKYQRNTLAHWLPILRHQGNAIFARRNLDSCASHYLPCGLKRLVLECKVGDLRLFVVHLAVNRHTRRKQLESVSSIIGKCTEPVILAGDFNTFRGGRELKSLLGKTGLRTANPDRKPTFPAWSPNRELDFVLVSEAIRVRNFQVMRKVKLSDHLPLLLDFEIDR